jgi:hypothetical protein
VTTYKLIIEKFVADVNKASIIITSWVITPMAATRVAQFITASAGEPSREERSVDTADPLVPQLAFNAGYAQGLAAGQLLTARNIAEEIRSELGLL